MTEFLNSEIFQLVIIPILISFARIIDVTLGTIRTILVTKGNRFLAPILGFFEVLIWLIAIGQVMQNLTNFVNYFAYAFGFAMGNYIGVLIESKLAMGMVALRIVTKVEAFKLIEFLKGENLGVTVFDGQGATGHVHMIFTVLKRSSMPRIINYIREYNPNAFYSVEDIKFVSGGVFPEKILWWKPKSFSPTNRK